MPAPIVLVHGLRTSATMWRYQLEVLHSLGVPAIAVDLPGHGARIGSRFSLDESFAVIDEATSTLQASSGEVPYLVGFSLGGYLAIEWAARHPTSISGLLAVGCGTRPHPAIIGAWRAAAKVIHALPDRGRALNDLAVRLLVPASGAHDVLAGGVALEVMDDALRVLSTLSPLESLRSIAQPVLFVNGRYDHIRIQARRFLAATPSGRLVTVPGATHLVTVIRPVEFTKLLLDGYSAATGVQLPGLG